jgi:hypothetical protein
MLMHVEPQENAVHFHQGCPVCGRTLRIQVTLLGSRVFCQHCGGGFVAADASLGGDATPVDGPAEAPRRSRRVESLLERAAQLLEQTQS